MAPAAGADVLAVDGSQKMVARINARARQEPACAGRVRAEIMDGMALSLPDARFDAAISVFGADAVGGMREIARVLKPGGRVGVEVCAVIIVESDDGHMSLCSKS